MAGDAGELYEAALDAAQEYMTLQQALAAALRAGFLSLAQARYSMGADRVSALQYPTHMQATARVVAAPGDGTLELLLAPTKTAGERAAATRAAVPSPAAAAAVASVAATAPTAGQTDTAAAAATEPQAAAAASSSDGTPAATPSTAAATGGAGAGAEDVAGALQRLRLVAQHADSIMEQLAAKYCSDGASANAGGGELDGEYAEVAPPGRPLHWFGSLVAPSLRDAEGHFGRALELVVQAANARRRLLQGLDGYREAAAAGGEAAASAGR